VAPPPGPVAPPPPPPPALVPLHPAVALAKGGASALFARAFNLLPRTARRASPARHEGASAPRGGCCRRRARRSSASWRGNGAATGRGPRNTRGQQQTAAAAHLESLVKTSGGNLQRVTARTLSDAGQNVCGEAGLHGGDGGLPANNVEAALPFLTACDGAQRGRYRSEAGSKTDTARSSGTRKRAVHLDQMRNLLRVAHAVGRLQTTRMRG
jgi:hypothetical protein